LIEMKGKIRDGVRVSGDGIRRPGVTKDDIHTALEEALAPFKVVNMGEIEEIAAASQDPAIQAIYRVENQMTILSQEMVIIKGELMKLSRNLKPDRDDDLKSQLTKVAVEMPLGIGNVVKFFYEVTKLMHHPEVRNALNAETLGEYIIKRSECNFKLSSKE